MIVRLSEDKVDRRWRCGSCSGAAEEQKTEGPRVLCVLRQTGQDRQQQKAPETTSRQRFQLGSVTVIVWYRTEIIMKLQWDDADLIIIVQPSMFKTAAQKRRDQVPGAEEVHEDENTAVEIPVDQVTPPFNMLGKFYGKRSKVPSAF